MSESFDQPLDKRHRRWRTNLDSERTGIVAERIARFTGTPKFIIWLTLFVTIWLLWNSLAPERLRFDSASLGFTALTLMLSSRPPTPPRSFFWRKTARTNAIV